MQIAVAVAEPDMKLQRLTQVQSLIDAESQQHAVGESRAGTVPPPLRRFGHLGGCRLAQIAVEPAAVGQYRLGRNRGLGPLVKQAGERRRIVVGRRNGIFGH